MAAAFENRIALVTGGSRGIGRATALRLASEGADVAISYASRGDSALETVGAIEALGRRAVAAPCNVADPDQVGQGGLLSVRASPDAAGTWAALWVKQVLDGKWKKIPSIGFPEKGEIVLSLSKIVPLAGGSDTLFARLKKLAAASHTIYLEK